jgi:DNA-binding NarL/FixJ family response regulator/class 3 adenylate cyclase
VAIARSRFLATVLVTDIVRSTEHAVAMGDDVWVKLLDRHDATIRRLLRKHGGREIKMMGDGALATFEVPAKAVTCAGAIVAAASKLGLQVRAGIHSGECDERGGDLGGIAVHVAARIADRAQPGEVLVSNTVKDLVTGSDLVFSARGSHELKGVARRWQLFALGADGTTPRAGPKRSRPEKQAAIRVVLVDDHPLWRQTLRGVLQHGQFAAVVGEAADGVEAVAMVEQLVPDVVVMDIDMPGVDGVHATEQICAAGGAARVLVLSSSDERAQVLAAVRAGASGYLLKTAGPADITDGVQRVHAGELVFPPSLASFVLAHLRGDAAPAPGRRRDALDDLTKREREVLALMAEGRSNQAICDRIHVSTKTLEGHVSAIFTKLGLEATPDDHRRVLAVIAFLEASAM